MLKFVVLLTLLAQITQANYLNLLDDVNQEWFNVPQSDGTWKLFHRIELVDQLKNATEYFESGDIRFFLFTRANQNYYQEVKLDDLTSLQNSNFDPSRPTRIMIHGWGGNGQDHSITEPKNAFLEEGDYNCFGVDWTVVSDTPNYLIAVDRIGKVGEVVARFIDFLIDQGGTRIDLFGVIGHSLGGHVAGHVGKNMGTGRKLDWIVSLDPAGPLFFVSAPSKRVDASDATYVEIIHTNRFVQGFASAIGHADFYLSGGGPNQPGCGDDSGGACAHARSVYYYAESITTKVGFMANSCASYASVTSSGCDFTGNRKLMGGSNPGDQDKRGVYWLTTNPTSPYAMG